MESSDRSEVRDPLLHRVRTAGPVLEDHREVWLSSVAMGEIYYDEWKLSVENELNVEIPYNCKGRDDRFDFN